jgi:hypothetical protein
MMFFGFLVPDLQIGIRLCLRILFCVEFLEND